MAGGARMSMKLITAAWTVCIDPSAKAVLVSLADQAHEDNDGECWPAVASIAERTCLGLRTVQGALQRLQELIKSVAVVQKSRLPTKATRSSQRRRMDSKTQRGKIKELRGRITE